MSIVFIALGILRPRLAGYGLLALFVLFDEIGPGFTTLSGSFVFNSNFVGFGGFRLIEVVTLSAYIPILMLGLGADRSSLGFSTEKTIAIVFALLVVALSLLEYFLAQTYKFGPWRLVLTGIMQFHILTMLFRDEESVQQLIKVLLILLCVKAAWGFGMWAIGFGAITPRGKLPFFWDSRQVEAFSLGATLLMSYLLNYDAIDRKQRLLPLGLAVLMGFLLLLAVVGSIRRTIWVTTIIGMLLVLILSRRTTALHYFGVLFIVSMMLGVALLAPGLEKFRSHMGQYVESLNLFNDYQSRRNIDNDVHVQNVNSYTRMILDNPDILAFGSYGPAGLTVQTVLQGRYGGDYQLGVAHNGILRSTLFFGVVGLALYLAFHMAIIRRAWWIYWQAPESQLLKHMALACAAKLLFDFASSLFYVPPFWTVSKGLFYTFIEAFVIGFVAFRVTASQRTSHARERSAIAAKQSLT